MSKAIAKLSNDDAIRAAIVAELIKDWQAKNDELPSTPSIAVDGSKEPSPELLAYLRKTWPNIRPLSACKISGEDFVELPGEKIETCQVRFRIGKLDFSKDVRHVDTDAVTQVSAGGFGAWGCSYKLALDHDKWSITDTSACWVS